MPNSARGAWAECEVLTEVDPTDRFIFSKLFGCAFFQDFALKKQIGAVGDVQGFLHVVVGDEHPDALVTELIDDALDVLDGNGVHAGKRLVE